MLGNLPENISSSEFLNTIGENIIIADKAFNIVWMNDKAESLLSHVAPLYDMEEPLQMIGINMSNFHENPDHQERIMKALTGTHQRRINIKDTFIADIVVNPIHSIQNQITGYVVLLMDVTTKAIEETQKEQLIHKLSVPILHLWENVIAVTLIGAIDQSRFERILTRLLKECEEKEGNYVILDVSEVTELTGGLSTQINRIGNCLQLMGTECIIVGITPKLSFNMVKYEQEFNYQTFFSLQSAIKYIFKKENIHIE